MTDPAWERFSVSRTTAVPLTRVYHTAHVREALDTLCDGRIRSDMIWRESRLRNTRTQLAWVSPNRWDQGSIYGTVVFEFDWTSLVEGQNLYWVDERQHQTRAYRILVTPRQYNLKLLAPYDPEADDGPLVLQGGRWTRTGWFNGELLIDDDLSLSGCAGISLDSHHERICRVSPDCPERGTSSGGAGDRLVAGIVGRQLDLCGLPLSGRDHFLNRLLRRLCPEKPDPELALCEIEIEALIGAALLFCAEERDREARVLASLSHDVARFTRVFRRLAERHLGTGIEWETEDVAGP